MSGPLRKKHPFLGGCQNCQHIDCFPDQFMRGELQDSGVSSNNNLFPNILSPTAGGAQSHERESGCNWAADRRQLLLPLPNCRVTILFVCLLFREKPTLKQKWKLLLYCQLPPFYCPLAICLQTETDLQRWLFLLGKKVKAVSATP